MRPIVPALFAPLFAGALAAPSEAGPRATKAGKIVRVERVRTGTRGSPRICQLIEARRGTCYGKAPVEGEIAWLVDAERNHGQVRIGKVTPSDTTCATPQSYSFEVEPLDADIDKAQPYAASVLIDVDVSGTSKMVDTTRIVGPDGESVWLAVDRHGQGTTDSPADLIVTTFSCDEQGQILTGGYGNGGYCMSYYTKLGSRWEPVRRDIVVACRY